jgi:hypothetical protein
MISGILYHKLRRLVARKQLFIRLKEMTLRYHLRLENRDITAVPSLHHLLCSLLDLNLYLLWLERYYPDIFHLVVTEEMTKKGLGTRGAYTIPKDIWDSVVPSTLRDDIHRFQLPDSARQSPNTETMLHTLKQDNFLLPTGHQPNIRCFVIPKTSEKCSLIADMRLVNALHPQKPPSFRLPTLSLLCHAFSLAPRNGFWATKLDLRNFFWSLRLPHEWIGCFRVTSGTYDALPFGWNLSPVLAQKTLTALVFTALIAYGLLPCLGSSFFLFIYLDDILILAWSQTLCGTFTSYLANFLTVHQLVISPKSELEPTQKISWLGKTLDLKRGSMGNTIPTLLRTWGLALLASVSRLTQKRLQVLLGTLNWVFRPRNGLQLFTWSWYARLHRPQFFVGFATAQMRVALFDLISIGLFPWEKPILLPPPALTPQFCVDAAQRPDGSFQLGLFSPMTDSRFLSAPSSVRSQQVAEFYAIIYTAQLLTNLGMPYGHIIGDNQASLLNFLEFKPFRGQYNLMRSLRTLFNHLWCHPTPIHISWTPSAFQPADPLSRLNPSSLSSISENTRLTHQLWCQLLSNPLHKHYMGAIYLS